MNYRHAYHAGGVADVFKHTVLIALLARLRQKETAFFVLETHAGIGLYDLQGPEAAKTGEFQSGIARLLGAETQTPLLAAYRARVAAANPAGGLRHYPGSPLLIAGLLRPHDRAVFCELHEEDHAWLKRGLLGSGPFAVHHRDGYEAIGAFLPPRERRGLVFIDPPFEAADEFARAAKAISAGHARFPQGLWALWYPVKERPAIWRFQEEMIAAGIKRQTAIEFLTTGETDSRALNGSGMLLINPPYRLEEKIMPALEELRGVLAPAGRVDVKQLAGE